MRDSNVLIAGLKGINKEVVKNIVLAGIGRVTVIDGKSVSKEDLAAQFLLREEDVGSNVRTSTRQWTTACSKLHIIRVYR